MLPIRAPNNVTELLNATHTVKSIYFPRNINQSNQQSAEGLFVKPIVIMQGPGVSSNNHNSSTSHSKVPAAAAATAGNNHNNSSSLFTKKRKSCSNNTNSTNNKIKDSIKAHTNYYRSLDQGRKSVVEASATYSANSVSNNMGRQSTLHK